MYRDKKSKKQEKHDSGNYSQAVVPRNAYYEDAPETDDRRVAIVDAPPAAPSPPPAVNVFDFLVDDQQSNAPSKALVSPDTSLEFEERKALPGAFEDDDMAVERYREEKRDLRDPYWKAKGFTYGDGPVQPAFERYDSYTALPDNLYTPAPLRHHARSRSDDIKSSSAMKPSTEKKRKRQQVEELDLSLTDSIMTDAPPPLHSGLTGGLNRLMRPNDFPPSPDYSGNDYVEPSPLPMSPQKRSKRDASTVITEKRGRDLVKVRRKEKSETKKDRKREESPKERRRHRRHRSRSASSSPDRDSGRRRHRALEAPDEVKRIEYHYPNGSAEADDHNALVPSHGQSQALASTRAEFFLSFISKGPDSERGYSMNKALKRYHRERYEHVDGAMGRADEEKELWKSLRLKRNDRGEVVVFMA